MTRHCTTSLFEFNNNFVDNDVRKNLHVIILFVFFISSIPTRIFLVYTDDIFSSVNTNGVSDRKNLVNVSVCIHRFSGSVNAIGLNYAEK